MAKKSEASRESGESWCSRMQVAVLLGVSEDELDALHGAELHPWQEKDRRYRYPLDEVARVIRARLARDPRNEGKTAAKAFALFGEGKPLATVVVETEQSPTVVKRLFAEYLEMSGGLSLSRAAVESLKSDLGPDAMVSGDVLAAIAKKELASRYQRGYDDGKAEAEDYGEVVDLKTGERRRVPPR